MDSEGGVFFFFPVAGRWRDEWWWRRKDGEHESGTYGVITNRPRRDET